MRPFHSIAFWMPLKIRKGQASRNDGERQKCTFLRAASLGAILELSVQLHAVVLKDDTCIFESKEGIQRHTF